MFGTLVLNEIWIIDLSSASASPSKVFFFKRKSFKLRCETVIGIVLCFSHQACHLLYCLSKINCGIYMYQFTFEWNLFCFWMWLWFRIWTKILADQRIWRKRGSNWQTCILLFIPLNYCYIPRSSKYTDTCKCFGHGVTGYSAVMHQSNQSFNIFPWATPWAFEFLENICSNPPLSGQKAVQIPPSLTKKLFKCPHPRENYHITV